MLPSTITIKGRKSLLLYSNLPLLSSFFEQPALHTSITPAAIKASGISCVIAKTFARIFYRNAINIGLPIIECEEAAEKIDNGDEVEIDFDSGVITNKTKNETYQGQSFPEFLINIINSNGLLNSLK